MPAIKECASSVRAAKHLRAIVLPSGEMAPDDRGNRWDQSSVHIFQGTRGAEQLRQLAAQGNHLPQAAADQRAFRRIMNVRCHDERVRPH